MKASKHKKYWWNKSLLMVLFLSVFLTTSKTLHSQQNLILNPSVEDVKKTPNHMGDYIDYYYDEFVQSNVLNWWVPYVDSIEQYWTPDVYSLLSDPTLDCSAPNGFAGFQQPKNGNNYLGLILLFWNVSINNFMDYSSEHAAGKFSEYLLKDSLYEFSCYMSKADLIQFSTNAFDVVITYDTILDVTRLADFGYKIYSEQEIFRDSINWVQVKACFKAKGGEKGFAIGNFHSANELKFDHIPNIGIGAWGDNEYRFFDEFSLKACPTCCLDQFPFEEHINVTSNPGTSNAPISLEVFAKGPTKVRVFDAMGRVVFEHAFNSNQEKIFLPLFAKGIYQYALINENGICDSGKLMMWE